MSGDWLHILIALVSGGAVGGLIANYIAIRKMPKEIANLQAQTDAIAAKSWGDLIDKLSGRVTELECKLKERELQREDELQRIDDLEAEIDELRDWIKAKGLVPPERKRTRKA